MPKEKIENLISELNDVFGSEEPSAAQRKLMADLESHVHSSAEAAPVDATLLDSIEMGLESLEEEHPNVAMILKESLKTLRNIGV